MADGFIVRKGGVSDATPGPTISFVSKTENSVTFTITNNSLKARDITYGLTTPPTTTTINLAAGATSSNQTISSITEPFVTIFAQAEDSAITEFRVRLEFPPVFTAATGGTTLEYDDGGKRYKSHTFTSDGTFEVTTVGDAADDRNKVDYLIIAGGGSGGRDSGIGAYTGGGGAGGYRTTVGDQGGLGSLDSKVTVTATSFSVTVGAGGANNTTPSNSGTNSSVTFGGTITSQGGGRGAAYDQSINTYDTGQTGGSGGGASGAGGASTSKAGTANQGFAGGNGSASFAWSGGGGGGAGVVGSNAPNTSTGGNGGNGLANLLRTGSNETRAGGGGAGGNTGGTGGIGGGGNGVSGTSVTATNGTVNTGSGGGGASTPVAYRVPGQGGSGLVVIRYEIAPSV